MFREILRINRFFFAIRDFISSLLCLLIDSNFKNHDTLGASDAKERRHKYYNVAFS